MLLARQNIQSDNDKDILLRRVRVIYQRDVAIGQGFQKIVAKHIIQSDKIHLVYNLVYHHQF